MPFIFALGPGEPGVNPGDSRWPAPLPVSRHAFGPSPAGGDFDARVTYGDYFRAVQRFLVRDDLALLRGAIARRAGRDVAPADVSSVGVYLLKHGAFYHPSYIKVNALGRCWSFVLNVAVSAHGRKLVAREFENLDRLNRELGAGFWPPVFGKGSAQTDGGLMLPMFLGQWLEGFYEFHLTPGTDSDHRRVVLWNHDRGHQILTNWQARQLLCQAARILAYAYNPLTFEAISDWHHAAGDFVANPCEGGLDLRLITVRRYGPITAFREPDVAAVLEALLIYLVDISLKLRLDRLDGTGRMACHPPETIPAICRGFLEGLQAAAVRRDLPDDFAGTVRRFLALHTATQISPVAHEVLAKYAPASDERIVLDDIVDEHVAHLAGTLTAF